jgi:uncharacterized protein
MSIRVTDLWRYPVKSCRGERLREAIVEPWGLAGDRRWMIVDAAGVPVTAREYPPLVLVTPTLTSDGIRLASPGLPDLTVPVPAPGPTGSRLVPVNVWGSALDAALAGDEASQWLGKIVTEPVRLVYLDDPTRRPTDPDYSDAADRVTFADNYPLLLTSVESLAAINEWIAAGPHPAEAPVPMTRFRPSVVVQGAPAWAEDGWRRVRIGDVVFRMAREDDRCVFTTIDPETAVKGKEPLVTLARHRRWDGKVWFGVYLIPDEPRGREPRGGEPRGGETRGGPVHRDMISVGDPVEILA